MASKTIFLQAGVIPFRRGERGIEVLLVSSRSGKRWVFPKGLIEAGDTPLFTAEREALEEAGARGTLHPEPLGRYRYRKWGGVCDVEMYAMEVTELMEKWAENAFRVRLWSPLESVPTLLREPVLVPILGKLDQLCR
ncbi:MAG: NUDIX hydrolase [Bacteroidota bacterium]|nr:NUDIX hydrolase [Bacteroidota bacterium]